MAFGISIKDKKHLFGCISILGINSGAKSPSKAKQQIFSKLEKE